jgi:hypothetical protein
MQVQKNRFPWLILSMLGIYSRDIRKVDHIVVVCKIRDGVRISWGRIGNRLYTGHFARSTGQHISTEATSNLVIASVANDDVVARRTNKGIGL